MQDKSLKYVFLVQGEGRGHMTQAITLSDMLVKAGHEVEHVFVGTNSRRVVPGFFVDKVQASDVELLPSPGFVTDKKGKGIRIWATILHSFINLKRYVKSIIRIHQIVSSKKPDVLLNFYDPIGGIYNFLLRPKLTYMCIGHQYLAHHQDFEFAPGKVDKWLFLINNKLTAIGAKNLLALSFASYANPESKKLGVFPPLLRNDVIEHDACKGDYLLVYILNKGYGEELIQWHGKNPEVKLHCFWDNQEAPEEFTPHENLTFHRLNDQKFLDLMSGCKGYVSTAGFESICEAMYLGKPVMTVPVQGHYEQSCNAIDAVKAGAGITANQFDLSGFIDFLNDFHSRHEEFKTWVANAEQQFLSALTKGIEKSGIKKDTPLVQSPLALPQHAH